MHPTLQTVSGFSFKCRLNDYTQKAGLSMPVYITIKEGPPHELSFKSSVVVNNISYDSLSQFQFANRIAAEHSAAEAALKELAKAGQVNQSISVPVDDTGFSKYLLEEYAQKMKYAIPVYLCEEYQEKEGYICSVEVGGVKYIGDGAKRKKEAEFKAARTALLSIHAAASKTKKVYREALGPQPALAGKPVDEEDMLYLEVDQKAGHEQAGGEAKDTALRTLITKRITRVELNKRAKKRAKKERKKKQLSEEIVS